MQKHFNNITAAGRTYRLEMAEKPPERCLWVDQAGNRHFWASVTDATSGSIKSPRTEYRETEADTGEKYNWLPSDHLYNALIGRCSIDQVPGSGKVIFAQIHAKDAPTPFVKLLLSGGHIRAEVRVNPYDTSSPFVLKLPYRLGEVVEFALNVSRTGDLTIGLNGVSYVTPIAIDWSMYRFYFKAGAYVIDTKGAQDDGGKVTYSRLEVYHGSGRDASSLFKDAARQYLG